jgi:starch phosphorylase
MVRKSASGTMTSQRYTTRHSDVEGFDSLAELALDMRWSWNHSADLVWRQLDPDLWELTHNPWAVLQTVARDRILEAFSDPSFRKDVARLLKEKKKSTEAPAWFQITYPASPITTVAYFSMEFMLSEALPIYSGGLGNVAGDQLKAASDLGVPVVGVGLLYQQGYFRQVIDKEGNQRALYPYNDPGSLPVTPVREPSGEWLRLSIDMPSAKMWLRVWQVKVGRVSLYLLDSNDLANHPSHRQVTSELYGGGASLRLKQEIVLGIGGWRLLRKLGIDANVCHLNEGHAAFAILERARDQMEKTGQSFDEALSTTRAGNLFTTHTAVSAGFDRFEPSLMDRYFRKYSENELKIGFDELMSLGRVHPEATDSLFNMAHLAMRGSGQVNGVSALHGRVSRHILGDLFPRWPTPEVPVGHVTNGVHAPSWDSEGADALWSNSCGKERWLLPTESLESDIHQLSDEVLWQFRNESRATFIAYARNHLARQLRVSGGDSLQIEQISSFFSPDALTIGFARRFATYKRPNLLLFDPDRLIRLLHHPKGPVQLVIAGKAHPADLAGQEMVRQWILFTRRPEVSGRVIFLSDYDMLLSERLVQGVDLWLNTPRRPWEACGTSGMKVLVNGGLNFSELDGWWAEAYSPKVGWALGDGLEHGDDPAWDHVEAEALYEKLEQEVVPAFYERDRNNRPKGWIERIRESMACLTPRFSSNRAVREYTETYYLPAAERVQLRSRENGVLGTRISAWRKKLSEHWNTLGIESVSVSNGENLFIFSVSIDPGKMDPSHFSVELYADGNQDLPMFRQTMERSPENAAGKTLYTLSVPVHRSPGDYTARVVPCFPGVSVPLEASHILWQK